MNIRTPIALLFLLALPRLILAQPAREIIVGSRYSVQSEVLGEAHEYWVGLPDSYDLETESDTRYPLLLVLDGRSHFRYVVGMLSAMSASRNGTRRVPEMIVVGLASTNRERDFTPDKIVTRRQNDMSSAWS